EIRGLAKVLCDAATFKPIQTPLPPLELRDLLFTRGPAFDQPFLFRPDTRSELLTAVAQELQITTEQIETSLFADRPSKYLLLDSPAWTPEELIVRYNLELARGVLYWARGMQVDILGGYKEFWRYIKLFKLMFWATPSDGGGYHVELDGPLSPFVQSITRYGRQLAAFLPALLLCERWRMAATVQPPGLGGELSYLLNDQDPLPSIFKQKGGFDSRMEADFAAEFEAKFGQKRGKWALGHEDEVLLLADTVMIPDFSITHLKDGRRALVEIVGFWHPDYLRRKVRKVRQAGRENLILLVYEGVNLAEEKLKDIPAEVLYFKNKPILKDVIAAVKRVAQ
ncbi:MAG: DUF790 family protein, partial [Anaerolineae bacterium]|nr:DUF790 family protein [Anaerolineae bacterium]